MNIQRSIAAFIEAKSKKSIETASTYKSGIDGWLAWSDEHDLDPLTTDAVTGYHSHLVKEKTASTTTTYMAAVIGLLDYIRVMGQDHDVNMTRVRYDVRNGPRAYSHTAVAELDDVRKKEMPRLVEYFERYPVPAENDPYNHRLSALRNVALFWTLYETAGRIGEVRRLNRIHISHDTGKVTVTGKGNRPHVLRFGHPEHHAIPAILAYVKERTDSGSALFVAHSRNSNGKRLSTTSLTNIIGRIMRRLDFDERLTTHDIRHYRAAMMLKQDVPLHVIQQFLNHRDIGTTRLFYAPITDEEDMERHLALLLS